MLPKLALILLTLLAARHCRAAEPAPSPDSSYALSAEDYRRGMALSARRDFPAAVAAYTRAISLNPRFGLAYYRLAAVEAAQGKIDAASEHLRFAAANTKDTATLAAIAKDQDTLAHWKPPVPPLTALPDLDRYAPFIALVPMAFILVLFIAIALRKSPKAPEVPPVWTLEPELQSRVVPRNVAWSASAKKQLLMTAGLLVVATGPLLFSFLVTPALRAFIQNAGSHADAVIQRVYSRLEPTGGKHPRMVPRTHLVLSYSGAAPVDYRARSSRYVAGQTVSVHYLPSSPRWVNVDDDPNAPLLWIPFLACAVMVVAMIGTLALSTRPFTTGRVVQNGEITPVKIEALMSRGKSGYYARVSYTWNGERQEPEVRIFDSTGLWPGHTVTAFVDPQAPKKPVIYKTCPFRVVA